LGGRGNFAAAIHDHISDWQREQLSTVY